eukprot:gene6967-12589_t
MCYSDDKNFISKDPRIIDDIETKAAQVLGRFDLVVNAQKTERHKKNKERNDQIKILGSFTDIKKEMKNRKQMAQAAFSHHHHVLTNEKLAASTRIRAFNVYVKPVLLYNCQTWDLGEADRDALDACHRRLLRRVLRVFYPAKLPNDEVYRRAGVKKCRQRWTGEDGLSSGISCDTGAPPARRWRCTRKLPRARKDEGGGPRTTSRRPSRKTWRRKTAQRRTPRTEHSGGRPKKKSHEDPAVAERAKGRNLSVKHVEMRAGSIDDTIFISPGSLGIRNGKTCMINGSRKETEHKCI